MSVILSAQNLSRIYPARRGSIAAVHQVSLEIQSGEFVAVCGRSGSGKSTLMALLGAIARPDQGTLHLEGTNLLQLSSYLFNNSFFIPSPFPFFTKYHLFLFTLSLL